MKKIILITITFLSFLSTASASPINDACVDEKKCLVLCSYESKNNRNITMYYNYHDKNMTIKWQSVSGGTSSNPRIFEYSKGPAAIDYLFSTSSNDIWWESSEPLSLSNFTCPKYGYLDYASLANDNQLCFDNDGNTCPKEHNFLGLTNFQASPLNYDFTDHVAVYAENLFEDIKNQISNGSFDLKSDLDKKINYDFKTNFLGGNDIPEFIANSEAYKNLEDNLASEFDKVKRKALAESEKEVANGTKTESEHEETKENWNVSKDELKAQINLGFKRINMDVTSLQDFNISEYCDSYLGNPTTPGQPAYYLQIAFNIMKYIAIVLLFVLTIGDFIKATASSNQDAMKKALSVVIKRIIIVIIIFFLPLLIEFLLTILGAYSPGTCMIS